MREMGKKRWWGVFDEEETGNIIIMILRWGLNLRLANYGYVLQLYGTKQ